MTVERLSLRNGYSISRVIKGGWQLAGGHGEFDRRIAVRDMVRFVDAGITTFDCADIYTGVEEMIGEFIEALGVERGRSSIAQSVQVHTKLVPDYSRLEVFTPADVEVIIDRSLQRLKLDALHMVQFYWWDRMRGDPVGVLSSLKNLQDKGKIHHLATTNWDTDMIAAFLDAGIDLVATQVQYSLLDSRPQGRYSDWCRERNISMLCYGTIAGGFLTEHWLGAADPGYQFQNRSLIKYRLIIDEFGGWDLFQSLLGVLSTIARKHGVTIAAVASRAILDRPNVGAVIIGARTARHLDQTLPIFDLRLDAEDVAALEAVLRESVGPSGPIFALEADKTGRHGRIMKYNLNTETG